MSTSFIRTLRALEADGFRRPLLVLAFVAALLGAWGVWFVRSPVARYEVSDLARLEVDKAIHLVQAPLTGKIVAVRLDLGTEVRAGDVLVELDANHERLQVAEERARIDALTPELRALQDEAEAATQALAREAETTRAAQDESRARLREAEVQSRFADEDAARLARLHREGLVPRRDLDLGKAESDARMAAAESLRLGLDRLGRELRTRESDRQAQLRRLQSEVSRLEGQKSTSRAAIDRLKYEIERRLIRAPVSGRLAEVATLRVGAVLLEGEKLGAVVPEGTLRIVAEYPPAAAFGRIRTGQPGRLRLHGFPWAQYGSIPATVTLVAGEIRDGHVRVELSVDPHAAAAIPRQHGLPGTVEVEIEKVTPAILALRAAGRLVSSPPSPSGASSR